MVRKAKQHGGSRARFYLWPPGRWRWTGCLGCPSGGVQQGWALLTASRPWAASWAPPRDSEGPALRVGRNTQEVLAGGLQAKQVVTEFLCGMRLRSRSFFLPVYVQLFQAVSCFCAFVKNQSSIVAWVCFWVPVLFCPIDLCQPLCQFHPVFMVVAL